MPENPNATTGPPPGYLLVPDAATHVGVTRQTIRGWLRDGLPCWELSFHATLIRIDDVEAWSEKLKQAKRERGKSLVVRMNAVNAQRAAQNGERS